MQKIFIKHYKQIVAIFMAIMLMFVSILTVSPIDVKASSTTVPQDLIINIGSDASKLNFNWFCEAEVSGIPSVRIIGVAETFIGEQGIADNNTKYNKVTVTGLKHSTTYECQVSSDGINYSNIYTFKTSGSDSFTFAAIGDPQIGASSSLNDDSKNWAIVVNEILNKDASFIVGVGDQVDYQKEEDSNILKQQYSHFISGLTQETRLMPFSVAIGNHEGYKPFGLGRKMFNYHYNITNKSEDVILYDFNLINYYYIYNNTLFVVLDTAPYPNPTDTEFTKSLIDAFDKVISTATTIFANQYDWLVVQTHKSMQCNPADYNIDDIEAYSKAGFEDLMTKYNVDLVLAGHTHSYVRSYPFKSNASMVGIGGPMRKGGITIDRDNMDDKLFDPDGTVYMILNSASGSEFYDIQSTPNLTSKVEKQNYIAQYTIIDVTDEKLTVNTYEVGLTEPIDSFIIIKTDNNISENSIDNNNLRTKNKPDITIITTCIIVKLGVIVTMIIVMKRKRQIK